MSSSMSNATQSTLTNTTPTSDPTGVLSAGADDTTGFGRAYHELETQIRAVPMAELLHINLDVRGVVLTTLARLPRLMSLRPEFVAHLPKFDVTMLDELETYARAAAHAYLRHIAASVTPPELASLAEEVLKKRTILLADVNALVARDLIDPAPLAELAGPVGHRNNGYDVLLLHGMLRGASARIEGKTAVTNNELQAAAEAAEKLLMAIGERQVDPLVPTETATVRDQAFTLFVRTYDEVRRAVAYLRWRDGDVDEYAPSLYAGRTPRRNGRDADSDVPTDPLASPPAAGSGSQGAASGNAQATPNAASSTGTGTASAGATSPISGLPGSFPFQS